MIHDSMRQTGAPTGASDSRVINYMCEAVRAFIIVFTLMFHFGSTVKCTARDALFCFILAFGICPFFAVDSYQLIHFSYISFTLVLLYPGNIYTKVLSLYTPFRLGTKIF